MLFVLQQLRVQRPKSYLCAVLGLAEGTTERANMVGRKVCRLWAIRESSQVKGILAGLCGPCRSPPGRGEGKGHPGGKRAIKQKCRETKMLSPRHAEYSKDITFLPWQKKKKVLSLTFPTFLSLAKRTT